MISLKNFFFHLHQILIPSKWLFLVFFFQVSVLIRFSVVTKEATKHITIIENKRKKNWWVSKGRVTYRFSYAMRHNNARTCVCVCGEDCYWRFENKNSYRISKFMNCCLLQNSFSCPATVHLSIIIFYCQNVTFLDILQDVWAKHCSSKTVNGNMRKMYYTQKLIFLQGVVFKLL